MNLKTIKNSRIKEDKKLTKIQGHVGHKEIFNIWNWNSKGQRERIGWENM